MQKKRLQDPSTRNPTGDDQEHSVAIIDSDNDFFNDDEQNINVYTNHISDQLNSTLTEVSLRSAHNTPRGTLTSKEIQAALDKFAEENKAIESNKEEKNKNETAEESKKIIKKKIITRLRLTDEIFNSNESLPHESKINGEESVSPKQLPSQLSQRLLSPKLSDGFSSPKSEINLRDTKKDNLSNIIKDVQNYLRGVLGSFTASYSLLHLVFKYVAIPKTLKILMLPFWGVTFGEFFTDSKVTRKLQIMANVAAGGTITLGAWLIMHYLEGKGYDLNNEANDAVVSEIIKAVISGPLTFTISEITKAGLKHFHLFAKDKTTERQDSFRSGQFYMTHAADGTIYQPPSSNK